MPSITSVTAFLASALAVSATAFDASSSKNVAIYWGQGANQAPLSDVCSNPSVDTVILGFVNIFPDDSDATGGYPGSNFGNACSGTTYEANGVSTKLQNSCPGIEPGISVCQENGKKVLLSLGGGYPANNFLKNETSATAFADFLWGAFGPKTQEWTDASKPRPFGDAVIDGFDFDIESSFPADSPPLGDDGQPLPNPESFGYSIMINQLRKHYASAAGTYYISGAPQCVIPDAHLADAIKKSYFDFIFVQLYNTPECSARADIERTSTFPLSTWETIPKYNTGAKIYMGLPASETASGSSDFYLSPSDVHTLAKKYSTTMPHFGGIMLWEAQASKLNTICGKDYAYWMKEVLGNCGLGSSFTDTCPSSSSSSSIALSTSSVIFGSSSIVSPIITSSSSSVSSSSVAPSSSSSSSEVSSSSSSSYSFSFSLPLPSSSETLPTVISTSGSPVIPSSSSLLSSSSAISSSSLFSYSSETSSSSSLSSYSSEPSSIVSLTTVPPIITSSTPSHSSYHSYSYNHTYSHSYNLSTSGYIPSSRTSSSYSASSKPISPGLPSTTSSFSLNHTYSQSYNISSTSYVPSSESYYPSSASSTPVSPALPSTTSSISYSESSSAPYGNYSASSSYSSGYDYPTAPSYSSEYYLSSSSSYTEVSPISTITVTPTVYYTPTLTAVVEGTVTESCDTSSTPIRPIHSHSSDTTYSHGIPSAYSYEHPVTETTTVITTAYVDVCPTGLTTVSTTYTTELNPYTTTPEVPTGWTTYVTVCTQCAATPTTLTLTKPVTHTTTWAKSMTSSEIVQPVLSASEFEPIEYTTTIQAVSTLMVEPIPASEYFSSLSEAGKPIPSDVKVYSNAPVVAASTSASLVSSTYAVKPVVSAKASGVDVKPVYASGRASVYKPVYGTAASSGSWSKTTGGPVAQFTGAANRAGVGAGVVVGFVGAVLAL